MSYFEWIFKISPYFLGCYYPQYTQASFLSLSLCVGLIPVGFPGCIVAVWVRAAPLESVSARPASPASPAPPVAPSVGGSAPPSPSEPPPAGPERERERVCVERTFNIFISLIINRTSSTLTLQQLMQLLKTKIKSTRGKKILRKCVNRVIMSHQSAKPK